MKEPTFSREGLRCTVSGVLVITSSTEHHQCRTPPVSNTDITDDAVVTVGPPSVPVSTCPVSTGSG